MELSYQVVAVIVVVVLVLLWLMHRNGVGCMCGEHFTDAEIAAQKNAGVDGHKSKIDGVVKYFSSVVKNVDQGHRTTIAQHVSDKNTLNATVSTLNDTVTQYETDLNTLKTAKTELEAQLATLRAEGSTDDATIAALQTELNSIMTAMKAINEVITNHKVVVVGIGCNNGIGTAMVGQTPSACWAACDSRADCDYAISTTGGDCFAYTGEPTACQVDDAMTMYVKNSVPASYNM